MLILSEPQVPVNHLTQDVRIGATDLLFHLFVFFDILHLKLTFHIFGETMKNRVAVSVVDMEISEFCLNSLAFICGLKNSYF